MSRLEEIKNDYAKELELSNWDDMIEYFLAGDVNGIFYAYENVINRYAKEVAQASLDKASETAQMNFHDGHFKTNTLTPYFMTGADSIKVSKESITNPDNIVLL